MVLTGYTIIDGVYQPNAITAGGAGAVDDTFALDTVSENAVQSQLIAAEFTRLIGNSPANFDTLEEINGRISSLSSGLEYKGSWDVTNSLLPTETEIGKMYSLMGTASTIDGVTYRPGMLVISNKANPSNNLSADWDLIDLSQQLTTLTQAQINDASGTVAGAITGTLFNAAANNWYTGKVDTTFTAGSTSNNAIAHSAVSTMRSDLLASVPDAGNTFNKVYNLITSLTSRVVALETNKVVSASEALPTAATTSLIHLYTDPDTVTEGDQSRAFIKLGTDWYGLLLPSDISTN